jgi:hydrogenase/urease accessory protein HupE
MCVRSEWTDAASPRKNWLKASPATLVLTVLFSVLSFHRALAHDPGLSTVTIRPRPNGVEATLTFALRDAAQLAKMDDRHDGIITQAEFARDHSQLEAVVATQFVVALDGKSAKPESIRSQLDENNNVELQLSFRAADFSTLEIQSKLIALLPPGHRQYLQLQDTRGRTITERLLSATADFATARVTAENGVVAAQEAVGSFADFLVLGVKHILTGYDHLLFLLGLLVVTRSFASSLKIITCFTVAHSITLAVATFGLVQIPGRIVEPFIAASIVYVGVENLLRGDDPKGRRLLTFTFGLIHGFGFASVLRELGVGSRTGGIALPLFTFNLGVELGQIMIAGTALPIIWRLRARPAFVARWAPACSAAVILLGSFWFVQRVWMN